MKSGSNSSQNDDFPDTIGAPFTPCSLPSEEITPTPHTTVDLSTIRWSQDGLIPVIAQEVQTGRVLMLAWMNATALTQTIQCGEAVYWSRSRQKLWHKGETSGHVQKVHSLRLDCDRDALLIEIEQMGGIACHTGRHSCFFEQWRNGQWEVVEPVLKDPHTIYGDQV